MDRRIQLAVDKLIESLGFKKGEWDRVAVPGGAYNLEVISESIEVSVRVNGAESIVLTVHEDCKSGHAVSVSLDSVMEAVSRFDLPSRFFLVRLDGTWEEKFDESLCH
jgi:carbonic anhydrase